MKIYLKVQNLTKNIFLPCFLGACAQIFSFYGVKLLSVSDSTILINTNPIFALILAALFLKEKIKCEGLLNLLLSFFGILLIVRP